MPTDEQYKMLYESVPTTDTDLEGKTIGAIKSTSWNRDSTLATWHWRFILIHFLLLVVWLFSVSSYLAVLWRPSNPDSTSPWSPLKSLVEYENQIFHTGFKSDLTKYQGAPNDQNTNAWEDLTKVGIILLDVDQAAKLPNKTVEWPKAPGKYLAAVSVFHQLHCVDYLRKTMFAASEGNATLDRKTVAHLDHCSDYLRQVLMCHGDISITSFRWNEAADIYQPVFDGLQQCRRFEPIYEWAEAHGAPGLRP